jgi:hypothetical protein
MLVAIGTVGSRFVGSIDALLVNADLPEAALIGGSPLTFIRIVAVTALDVAGWALVARSIARLRPAGSALLRGVGLVVVLAAVVAQILSFGFALGPGSVGLNVVILVENLALVAATAAIAWVFITRGGGRPPVATASAAIGAATWVTASIPLIVIATAFAGSHDENLLALQAPAIWLVAIGGLFTSVLFLVAFATGLADRPPAAEDPQPGILR